MIAKLTRIKKKIWMNKVRYKMRVRIEIYRIKNDKFIWVCYLYIEIIGNTYYKIWEKIICVKYKKYAETFQYQVYEHPLPKLVYPFECKLA